MVENLFWGGYTIPGASAVWYYSLIPIITIWSLIWKAWALWIAARKGQKVWYFFLLIINLLGILEILYIFVFSKKDMAEPSDAETLKAGPKEAPAMSEPEKMEDDAGDKESMMGEEPKEEAVPMARPEPEKPEESKMDMDDAMPSNEEEKKEEM